ncbi:hypothetical protein ODJ79_24965 [Actinoplanes sp. KI2]|uniref:hypothetical protein n=1 Tax=Actinoplanes sp. KI2 TaxID=2983315 RepID=UPI0021D60848|nr:hypothetical protein [Actinoplanes sp. KI2]MCU7726992.1 hypothetical protein [Actinoplanes sp. KI2]
MRIRRIAVSALLVAAVVVPLGSGAAMAESKSHAAPSQGHHSEHKPKKTKKPPKAVKFIAAGTVTAVDATAGTVTVKVKGGTKNVRRSTVTITVPSTARIVVNGAGKTLADIGVGYGITVTGTASDEGFTAARIEARGKKSGVKPTPTPTASPTPTDEPTDEPTDDPTDGPTDDPTDGPTDDPTATPTLTPTA